MENKVLCLAPWVYSFIGTQGERMPCNICDKVIGVNVSLYEMWNGDEMKSIRKKMMNGEQLEMCNRCDFNQATPNSTFRDFFNNSFGHLKDEILSETTIDGEYKKYPIIISYTTNACNFKCKMCWEGSSSQIQSEKIKNNIPINVLNNEERKKNNEIIENELKDDELLKNLVEIDWTGGEPLYWDLHWETLDTLIEKGYAKNIKIKYNTNLSTVEYKGKSIFDYFKHFKYVELGCSLDGTYNISEWIRTNSNYIKWKDNFSKAIEYRNNNTNIDVFLWITVTTPTMFDFENLYELCKEYGVKPVISSCYVGETFNLLTPRAFPKELVKGVFDIFLKNHINENSELINIFRNYIDFLLNGQHFHENDLTYNEVFKKGISHIKYLEENRPHNLITFEDILKLYHPMYNFYKNIS